MLFLAIHLKHTVRAVFQTLGFFRENYFEFFEFLSWMVTLVVVAGSLYPAVTTSLAVAFSSERMRWWQVLGVTLGLTGVALAAFGSVGD